MKGSGCEVPRSSLGLYMEEVSLATSTDFEDPYKGLWAMELSPDHHARFY